VTAASSIAARDAAKKLAACSAAKQIAATNKVWVWRDVSTIASANVSIADA